MNKIDILKDRAKKLAEVKDEKKSPSSTLEGVKFQLGSEIYMIEFDYLNEIYPLSEVTNIPSVPKFIYGLINIRSRVITVVNLKEFLGLETHKGEPCNKVIVLERDHSCFAILVDEVIGAISVSKDAVQKNLPTLSGVKKDLLKGFTSDGVIILDGQKILSSPLFKIDEKIS